MKITIIVINLIYYYSFVLDSLGLLLVSIKLYISWQFKLFFNFLYLLRPFNLATYTFINAIISCTISSSGSIFSFTFKTIIFPFEYLLIISSIKSYAYLVKQSLNATTNLFIFPLQ
jgi:hypothetical protein